MSTSSEVDQSGQGARKPWNLLKRIEHGIWSVMEEGQYSTQTLGEFLGELLVKSGIRQRELCARTKISPGYLSAVLKDEKRPSRDVLIQIAFGLGLDVDETSELLERGGVCRLREDVRRDAVIAICLRLGIRRSFCNGVLYEMGERGLGDAEAQKA